MPLAKYIKQKLKINLNKKMKVKRTLNYRVYYRLIEYRRRTSIFKII
jgi:hypothetical protein